MRPKSIFALSLSALAAALTLAAGVNPTNDTPGDHLVFGRAIHDAQIEQHLHQVAERWLRAGRGTPASNILAHLRQPARCALALPEPFVRHRTAAEVAAQSREGTMVLACLYECTNCPTLHLSTGTGFALTRDGAIATCHHLLDEAGARQFVVMSGDGRCFPIRSVLASDATNDIVILQLETGGAPLWPLPLETNAPVGSRVFVLGHPESHFYTFAEGLLARYFTGQAETGDAEMMSITADFAPGSSGCPILDDRGNAIGMADNIVRAGLDDEKPRGPSIVFKHCRPAAAIRALVTGEATKP